MISPISIMAKKLKKWSTSPFLIPGQQTYQNFSPQSLGMIVESTDIQPSMRIGNTRFWKTIPFFLDIVKMSRCSTKNVSIKQLESNCWTHCKKLTVLSFTDIKSSVVNFITRRKKWIKIRYWAGIFETCIEFKCMPRWDSKLLLSSRPVIGLRSLNHYLIGWERLLASISLRTHLVYLENP